jgi:uncharacterized damage-inducible protein DinB
MKEVLQQYFTYHSWANRRLIDCILSLPADMHTREIASSFPSLYETLKHMWNAESTWWQRMKMQDNLILPSTGSQGLPQVADGLQQQNKLWEDWVANASVAAIDHVFHYQNSKREQFRQPIWQMLLHLVNHGTYHRGQLVTMLRQLGVNEIPATDYIVWSRKK